MKKRFLKKLVMSMASVCLALFIAVGFAFSPAASVSAEVVTIETITEGEVWHQSWSADVNYVTVYLDVEETGFYNVTITDHMQTGLVLAYLTDYTTAEIVSGIYNYEISKTVVSEDVFLMAGHEYEIMCEYYEYTDDFYYLDADISVEFNKSNIEFLTLPNGALSSSDLQVEFAEEYGTVWCEYTTTSAGDYSFCFDDLHAFISVYSETDGLVYSYIDTEYEYYYDYENDETYYELKDKVIFNLEANTKYYFEIGNYYTSTAMLSMYKNSKTVKDVVVSGASETITCWDYNVDEKWFDYKISYTNGTAETKSYFEASAAGFTMPITEFLGEYVDINGKARLKAGKTPVFSFDYADFGEITDISDLISMLDIAYVDVQSVTDWLIDVGAYAVGEYDYCTIDNEGIELESGYFRIKVDETGYYGYTSWGYFEENLYYWSMVMVDEYNNIVQFNEDELVWPLVAGREYALNIAYQFSEESEESAIDFYFVKDADTLYSDVSKYAWYHDAVTYAAGRGIMSGYGGTNKFGSADSIQRQDFLVMLARLDGVDLTAYADTHGIFPDVPEGSYYEAAINWGYENGIVSGYVNGEFGVGDKITREQLVTFLYRYSTQCLADTSYSASTKNMVNRTYTDYKYVTDYAKEPVLWAIEKGVIKGKTDTTIAPGGDALRCEVAQMMFNIFKNDII